MTSQLTGIELEVCLAPEVLASLEFDEELDLFRPPLRQRTALAEIAAEQPSCVSAALVVGDRPRLVGYAAFHVQTDAEAVASSSRLLELGALEVAPLFRRRGIAGGLLRASFSQGRFDDAVVFARLYAWHYDLGRTGLGPLAYRRFLRRLHGSVGLEVVNAGVRGSDGAEGGHGAHGADVIMVRIGSRASAESVAAFERQLGLEALGPKRDD